MIRNLTEKELRIQHRHRCRPCGKLAENFCYCEDDPDGSRDCRDRVPGERNLACPTLKGVGDEHITALMVDEYESARRSAAEPS